jgi:hypothetical protein
MQFTDQMRTQPDVSDCEQAWTTFFKLNCNALFQTALLLSADADIAETVLVGSIDDLDFSKPPGTDDLAAWEKAVVVRSIETVDPASAAARAIARSVLQPGLWPVLQIERHPRICFVLRMLLGYTTASCAQILGIEECTIRTLLQTAIMQLQQGSRNTRRPACAE